MKRIWVCTVHEQANSPNVHKTASTCSKVIIYFKSNRNERVLYHVQPLTVILFQSDTNCGLFTASSDFDLYQFIAPQFVSLSFTVSLIWSIFAAVYHKNRLTLDSLHREILLCHWPFAHSCRSVCVWVYSFSQSVSL